MTWPEQPAHARPCLGCAVRDVALVDYHDIGPAVLKQKHHCSTVRRNLTEAKICRSCWWHL